MDKLKEFGYEPTEICESGIVATISGEKPGKTFLLRADMDALPMKEVVILNQRMDACILVDMICTQPCYLVLLSY